MGGVEEGVKMEAGEARVKIDGADTREDGRKGPNQYKRKGWILEKEED